MMQYISLILALPLLMSTCGTETKRVEVLVNEQVERTYTIDLRGPFSFNQVVSYEEIIEQLELQEYTGQITHLVVAADPQPTITVTPLNQRGNEAASITLSGYVRTASGVEQTLFSAQEFPVPLLGENPAVFEINSLVDNGVDFLQEQLTGFLDGSNQESFEFLIQGDSSPDSGKMIKAEATIALHITVTFEECIDVAAGLGDNECETP